MDRDCLQAMGLPCLTFFDCLNLHFACRDKIGTGQNRPFYPCFGPLRGSWSSKNWFGMAHQVVRYVTQPLRLHTMQQQKRWHFYNGGESGFLGRMRMLGINLQLFHSSSHGQREGQACRQISTHTLQKSTRAIIGYDSHMIHL